MFLRRNILKSHLILLIRSSNYPCGRLDKRCVINLQIKFFKAWPEDALEMVANKFLEDVELEDNVRSETVTMCKHFHESVRKMSIR